MIRNLYVIAAGHGIGDYAGGDLVRNTVLQAGTLAANTYDAFILSSSGGTARLEANEAYASGCRYGYNLGVATGNKLVVAGNSLHGTAPSTKDYNNPTPDRIVWEGSTILTWEKAGGLAVGANPNRRPFHEEAQIIAVYAAVNTAPTGATIIIDVNKNGTSIYPTATKPTIATSAFLSPQAVPDTTRLSPGDYLTYDIDQVGSTVAGSDLTVAVLWAPHRYT